ncbi:MAG: alpha-glucan family phosphorylase [Candidatus Omnitrophica bacterium]|nr:alpha-glucan family phosphorylase [Candidatus Omnitrophota bacterium]
MTKSELIPLRKEPQVAYLSMEIGFDSRIPTYSGGLGVLAGDTLRACADLGVPIIGVTLLSEKGYFRQEIDSDGNQIEHPVDWNISEFLELKGTQASVFIEGREVRVRAWEYFLVGSSGHQVPIYFLDTNVPENSPEDRRITAYLYGGDTRYRLIQEAILGIGGVRLLRALGYLQIRKFHMNEGHAALLILDLLSQEREHGTMESKLVETVRKKCVFTTHTPVPAGHDRFPVEVACAVLKGNFPEQEIMRGCPGGELNLTRLALDHSEYINGVAKKHGEISRGMFPGYSIDSITNGVRAVFWVADPMKELFDQYLPGWRSDPFLLRNALLIPQSGIQHTHQMMKKALVEYVEAKGGKGFREDVFTIGFARRAATYKRADLLFRDPAKLSEIAEKAGALQIVYAGKAHPSDMGGKEVIKRIIQTMRTLQGKIPCIYLADYDVTLAKLLTAGVDLWLNTPRRPQEASGTSGMKACLNGIPNLSVLDGWWIEGHIEGVTGWAIGPRPAMGIEESSDDAKDADDLYHKLGEVIVPLYYNNPAGWSKVMHQTIAINGSFFNSHRMVQQYVLRAYFS